MPAILIEVTVKPNARGGASLAQEPDGSWTARVRSPPIEGRANAELIALIADHFRCPRSAITLRRGASGRRKSLRIELP